MDKTVDKPTADEETMPDAPAAGRDGKVDESNKEGQSKSGEAPEEDDDKGGKDNAGGAVLMEEGEPEGEEAEPKSVAKQGGTRFIIADDKGKATSKQKGQFVKQIVQPLLEGKHLTSEPLSAIVLDGEEHVMTVMRSMKDDGTKKVVETLR